jgi:MFS family permease
MGIVSFALFDPQRAANAWAVVTVLAITLLPFSIIGPFTGVLLDRWPRQRMVMVTESIRLALCLAIAALMAWTSSSNGWSLTTIYILVLVVLSFNRFLLNGLGAGLADVVHESDYLDASSIMPMLGPIGLVVGGAVGGAIRLIVGDNAADLANALIFVAAALCCIATVVLASRIGRLEIGPLPEDPSAHPMAQKTGDMAQIWRGLTQACRHIGDYPAQIGRRLAQTWCHIWDYPAQIGHGLVQAWHYLRQRHPAMQGLGGVAVQHTMYGVLMTCIIMAYRNLFHAADNPDSAVIDMGIWFLASGVGFALSGVVAPWLGHRFGLRRAVVGLMLVSAVIQVVPGSIFVRPCLVIAAFIMGICSQSVKVCADTLVQLHVSDDYRGRVFAGYDMLNNVTLVFGALVAALVAPAIGLSHLVFIAVAVILAAEGVGFALLSRPWADEPRHAPTPKSAAASVGTSAKN